MIGRKTLMATAKSHLLLLVYVAIIVTAILVLEARSL
jgi:hypothetical protein